jgi:hypothetical protein
VFETQADFEDVRNYAKSRGLDMKNFFMHAAKVYINKYPQKPSRIQEDV